MTKRGAIYRRCGELFAFKSKKYDKDRDAHDALLLFARLLNDLATDCATNLPER